MNPLISNEKYDSLMKQHQQPKATMHGNFSQAISQKVNQMASAANSRNKNGSVFVSQSLNKALETTQSMLTVPDNLS